MHWNIFVSFREKWRCCKFHGECQNVINNFQTIKKKGTLTSMLKEEGRAGGGTQMREIELQCTKFDWLIIFNAVIILLVY